MKFRIAAACCALALFAGGAAQARPDLVELYAEAVRTADAAELERLLAPVFRALGIPAETVSLMLIRPISGGGAMAVATDLIQSHGPDSYIGRVAAVMLGST